MQTASPKNRLKSLREERGLELYDIAAVVRKSVAMVSRYESGQSEIPGDVMRTLAQYYGVTVEYAMGWDREEAPA